MYKLTKGTLSRIRHNELDCKILMDEGYKMDGEVNKDYEVINPYPVFDKPDELDELRAQAVKAGLAKSTAKRITNPDTLRKKIEDMNI